MWKLGGFFCFVFFLARRGFPQQKFLNEMCILFSVIFALFTFVVYAFFSLYSFLAVFLCFSCRSYLACVVDNKCTCAGKHLLTINTWLLCHRQKRKDRKQQRRLQRQSLDKEEEEEKQGGGVGQDIRKRPRREVVPSSLRLVVDCSFDDLMLMKVSICGSRGWK